MRKVVRTEGAPAAIGPYSQGVAVGGWIFVSGQLGLIPASGALCQGGIEAQTRQTITNLSAVLEAAGSDLARVVQATVYLADLRDFEAMNAVYGEFFRENPPARACVEVSRLPKGARVEIAVVATT